MKRIIIFSLLFIFTLSNYAYADFYVFIDKNTKEVLLIAKKKSNVNLSAADKVKYKSVKMQGKIKDYPLQYSWEYYKLVNKTFIVNTQKLSDEANEEITAKSKKEDMNLIKNRLYKDTCLLLKSEGIIFKEIKCSDF